MQSLYKRATYFNENAQEVRELRERMVVVGKTETDQTELRSCQCYREHIEVHWLTLKGCGFGDPRHNTHPSTEVYSAPGLFVI